MPGLWQKLIPRMASTRNMLFAFMVKFLTYVTQLQVSFGSPNNISIQSKKVLELCRVNQCLWWVMRWVITLARYELQLVMAGGQHSEIYLNRDAYASTASVSGQTTKCCRQVSGNGYLLELLQVRTGARHNLVKDISPEVVDITWWISSHVPSDLNFPLPQELSRFILALLPFVDHAGFHISLCMFVECWVDDIHQMHGLKQLFHLKKMKFQWSKWQQRVACCLQGSYRGAPGSWLALPLLREVAVMTVLADC